jgi:hypothetical protein
MPTDESERGAPKSWRDLVKVHPAAALFPMMSDEELDALAQDIDANGLSQDVVLWTERRRADLSSTMIRRLSLSEFYLLDGRNRLAAVDRRRQRHADRKIDHAEYLDGLLSLNGDGARIIWGDDPWSFVVSANVHRRHLTSEQKRELTATLLAASPERSDRATAKLANVSDKTVAAVRAKLQANAEIPNKAERAEASGRKARGRKPSPVTAAAPPPPPGPAVTPTSPTVRVTIGRDGKARLTDKPERKHRTPRPPRSGPPPSQVRDTAIVQFSIVLHAKPKETLDDFLRLVRDEPAIGAKMSVEHRLAHVREYIAVHGVSLDGDLKPIARAGGVV